MKPHHSPDLANEIKEYLKTKPDALRFIIAYGKYVELIDDLVDEPFDASRIQETTHLAMQLFSSHYWQENKVHLWLIESLTSLTYFDSVAWESSSEEWKRRDARALSHAAYNMLFAVLILECGLETAKCVSLKFREGAHKEHLNDPPIVPKNG